MFTSGVQFFFGLVFAGCVCLLGLAVGVLLLLGWSLS